MKSLSILITLFLLVSISLGQVLNVPIDYATIQEGIDASSNGDTVLVERGVYFENINLNGKSITLASNFLFTLNDTDILNTIIDGSENGSVLTYENGEDSTSRLVGFKIQNGRNYYGGGIYCSGTLPQKGPSFENLTISNNTAIQNFSNAYGGGLYCKNYEISISSCTVMNNWAKKKGGGMYFQNSLPKITGTSINYNTSLDDGGGLYFVSDNANSEYGLVKNCTINNNNGGGLYFVSDNTNSEYVLVENCTINNNDGGGVYIENTNVDFIDLEIKYTNFDDESFDFPAIFVKNSNIINISTAYFSDNCGYSGAIYLDQVERFALMDSKFHYNLGFEGGSLYAKNCDSIFIENTYFSNTADDTYEGGFLHITSSFVSLKNVLMCDYNNDYEWGKGGAIYAKDSDFKIYNSTFANVSAPYCSLFCFDGTCNCEMVNVVTTPYWEEDFMIGSWEASSNSISVSHCNIGEENIYVAELEWLEGNVYVENPEFVGVGPHPYQIMADSPFADAGTIDTANLNLPALDLAGNARINNARINNGRIDMGAYEWDITVSTDNHTAGHNLDKPSLNLFPNPFVNKITTEFVLKNQSDVNLIVISPTGQTILSKYIPSLSKGEHTVNLDIPNVSPGVYLIELITLESRIRKKLVKLH